MSTSGSESIAQGVFGLIELVFSLLTPAMLLVSCAASWVLAFIFHLPQFGLLAFLSDLAVVYAMTHVWAAIALIALVAAAVPLVRVAYKEHATRTSDTLGYWTSTSLGLAFTVFLAVVWPPSLTWFQEVIFAFLLFLSCGAIMEALMSTLKLRELSRPQPGREVVEAQKAHGDARVASEAEAIALLNSKK